MKRFFWRSPAALCRPRRFSQGFTLLEILVVLGIIIVLASLIFPVLSRAKENSKRGSCMSNLRQIALATQQYLLDSDRRYPPSPAVDDGSEGWAFTLSTVTKSDPVFQCPSEQMGMNDGFTDYWMNGGLLAIHDVKVRFASSVILCGDGDASPVDYILGPPPAVPDPDAFPYDNWEPDKEYAQRHLGGSNFSFTDGHVKWLHPDQISTTADPDGKNFTFVVG